MAKRKRATGAAAIKTVEDEVPAATASPKAPPQAAKKKYEIPEGVSAWTETGAGRKQCPVCKFFVPNSSRKCKVCLKHEFAIAKKPETTSTRRKRMGRPPKGKSEALSTGTSVAALLNAVEAVGGIGDAMEILRLVARSTGK